jgi:hypothetical protein
VVEGGVVWAGIGALIDWAHAGRTILYLGGDPGRHDARWYVLPIVTPRIVALGIAKRIR